MRKECAPYRVPANPGYVGGYNWRAMLAGFALLLFSNIAGTQYIASRFQYRSGLGDALYRAKAFALYQPFAWSVWVLRYMGARNPEIHLPVQIGLCLFCARNETHQVHHYGDGVWIAPLRVAMRPIMDAKLLAKYL